MQKFINKLALILPMLFSASYWGMLKLNIPSFPVLSAIFNTSLHNISIMIALSFILSGLSGIIWGRLLDIFSEQKLVIFITLISVMSLLLAFYLKSFFGFAFFYVSSCILMNMFAILSRRYPIDRFHDEKIIKQSLSWRLVGGYMAVVLFPLSAGLISMIFNWKYAFIIMSVWIVIVLVIYLIVEKSFRRDTAKLENRDKKNNEKVLSAFWYCIKNKEFRSKLLIYCGINILVQSYVIAIPFWLTPTYKISSVLIALYLIPVVIPGLLTPLIHKYISSCFRENRLILYAQFFIFLSGILAILIWKFNLNSALIWLIPGIIINLCFIASAPTIIHQSFNTLEKNRGLASGIFSLASYSSGGIGVYIVLHIQLTNFYWEGILIMLVSLLTVIVAFKKML